MKRRVAGAIAAGALLIATAVLGGGAIAWSGAGSVPPGGGADATIIAGRPNPICASCP